MTDDHGLPARELLVQAGVLRLNASASAIWDLLDGRRDEVGIAAALAAAYPGSDPAGLRDAVAALLAQLETLGAIVRRWRPLDPCPVPRWPGPAAPGATAG